MKQHILLGPFKALLPMSGLALKGSIKDDSLPIVPNAGIWIEHGFIKSIDTYQTLKKKVPLAATEIMYLEKDYIGLPGFVDAHTHICYAGTRAQDYALRNSGKSYLEIAKAGGGIWDTVTQTRKASETTLIKGIIQRAKRHLMDGITTIEVKSGYGLSVTEELKMLRAIKEANSQIEADLIATCLAAHTFPKDYKGNIYDYVEEMIVHLFPSLKEEQLTNRVDAFIEEGAFSNKVITPYFEKAQEMGFDITVHADQFSTGGSEVAVNFKAVSADHLEVSSNKEISLLAKSNVIATALPGASIGLGCSFTPARKILDAGGALAIASDWNPGSAPMGNLVAQAAMLGTFQKLTNAEVFAGITFRAAAALNKKDRGRLEVGCMGDIVAYPGADYREILYQQGSLKPSMVWKKGQLIS